MKLEVGKKYNRRDGGVRVLIVVGGRNSDYEFEATSGAVYMANGRYDKDVYPHGLDLISEHVTPGAKPQDEFGPWIGWNGGECPVGGDNLVALLKHSPQIESGYEFGPADAVDWTHCVAYRVKKEPEAVESSIWIHSNGKAYDHGKSGNRQAIITTKGDDISVRWAE